MEPIYIVALVVTLALFFDFTNGFHDTANAMATPIATGALKPRTAVAIASVMNLIGAFLSTAVATMISVSMINDASTLRPEIVFAGLTGAILWNLTTWFLGLPSSSSHALFGGLIGAVIAAYGLAGVNFVSVIEKILIPALFAPVIAGLAAWFATRLAYAITKRSTDDDISTGRGRFRYGQIFSSSLVALSHGTNDAQKTMGVITLVLVAGGFQASGDHVQLWVVVAAALAIAAGTYSGGWRIIKTMGKGLSEIKAPQGLAAEVASAATILASSKLGFALSTTQVASGAIIGSGLGRKGGKVRWSKAGHVVLGWLFTLPAAAIVGAISAWLVGVGPAGIIIDGIVALGVIIAIFQIARRNAVTHKHVASEIEEASEIVLSRRQQLAEARKAKEAAKRAKSAGKGKGKK
ncbi:MAG: anion permease [Micrococcales bacterium]